MVKCNICKCENKDNRHYCSNCGKNLSNQIEFSDILFFISKAIKFLSIFFATITFLSTTLINIVLMLGSFIISFICSLFLAHVGLFNNLQIHTIPIYLLKRYTLIKCKKNIMEITNVS